MPIQIIDGFKVKDYLPIDDRIVASSSRINISYKYDGLRVWDLSDQIPYVWINGKWQKENLNSVIFYSKVKPGFTQSSFNGLTVTTSNLLKVWNSETNELINSNIAESIYNKKPTVAINFGGKLPDLTTTLDVNGGMSSTGFTGIGSGITDLNASEIKSGLMDFKYIKPGLDGQILISKNNIVKWDYSDNIEFTYNSNISINTYVKDYQILLKGKDNKFYFSDNIIYNTNQILLKENFTGGMNTPNYSFMENKSTGVYLENNTISFSVNGDKKLTIDSYGIKSLDKFNLGNNYSVIKSTSDISFFVNGKTPLKVGSSISLPSIIKFYDVDTEYRMTDTEINILYNKKGFKLTSTNLNNIGDFKQLNINGLNTFVSLGVGTSKIYYETKNNFQNLYLTSENGYTLSGDKFQFTKSQNSFFTLSDKIYYNDKYYLSFDHFFVPTKINSDLTIRAKNIITNNIYTTKLNINNNNIQSILFCDLEINLPNGSEAQLLSNMSGNYNPTIFTDSWDIIENAFIPMGSVILDPRISLYVDPSTKNYVPSNYRRLKISCILQLKDKYSYVFNSKNILKLKLDNAYWWWGGSGTNLQLTAGSNDKVIYKTEVKLYPDAKKILLYIEILYNHSVPLQSIGQTVGILPIKIPSKLMIISKTK